MADAGIKETDKLLEELEKKIKKEYKKAGKEAQDKLDNYLKEFKNKDTKMLKAVEEGSLTKSAYKKWRTSEMVVGKKWEELKNVLAKEYTEASIKAMGMTNETMKSVYALNHNISTFEIEKASFVNTQYALYDKSTVERLIKKNPKLLPDPKVDIKKSNLWNQQKINSAVTQGILQGEPIDKIARRLDQVTGMGERSALRSARTMVTSAQNAGRMDSYKRAEEMGIEMEKVWVATIDERTRASHVFLHGEAVGIYEQFSNGLEYPADPNGDPEEVYNCRCVMVPRVKGVELGLEGFNEEYIEENFADWERRRK